MDKLNVAQKKNNDEYQKTISDLQNQVNGKKNDASEKNERVDTNKLQLMTKIRKNDETIRKLKMKIEE